MNNILTRPSTRCPIDREEDRLDSMSSDRMQEDDGNSIMAVRPTTLPLVAATMDRNSPPCLPVTPFVIPRRYPGPPLMEEDDDISVLTEFSLMDEEEDVASQVTARTVVTTGTTGTDSITIPRRNISQVMAQPTTVKRQHHAMMPLKVPHDNHTAKRRRKL